MQTLHAGLLSLLLLSPALFPAAVQAERRDSYTVKNAFKPVIRQAAQSVVRVFLKGRPTALGAIVDPQGYLLTKASEVLDRNGAPRGPLQCQAYSGQRYDAEVAGFDDSLDLALLKIKDFEEKAPAITWSISTPAAGGWVATPGIVSLPEAIGVISAPARAVKRRLAVLGVYLVESPDGAEVHRIWPSSGAAKAGLKEGDVVIALDGKEMRGRDQITRAIQERLPGDLVKLSILRGENKLMVEAELMDKSRLPQGSSVDDDSEEKLSGRLSRRRDGFPSVLQHDSILRPELCGGPLVNLKGEVIGLNIARASRVSSYAVPAALARQAAQKMISQAIVHRE